MRICCPHCGDRTIVTHSKKNSPFSTDVYCICRNDECAARFVMRIFHAHDLVPPRSTQLNALAEQIACLPDDERRELLKTYA